jgi:branched-chain amino acid aminotransferase
MLVSDRKVEMANAIRMTDQGPAPDYAVLDGEIVAFDDAKVHILTHTFNYGTGVFEGIRGYWNARRKDLFVVRLTRHVERLVANCGVIMLDPGYSVDEITDLCLELVRMNEFREDVYIRPIVYCPALRVGPGMSDEHALAIYNIPMGHYHDPSRALDVMVSTWRRTCDNAIPARGKINGAYVNSSLAITEARRAGFDDAILLNQDGHVSEGSVMNVFLVRGKSLVTPPVTANILEGITRTDVMALGASELGLRVVERDIDRTELYYADEVFFCGTGAKILGVGTVDRRVVGRGGVGPVTGKLQKVYDAIVHGDDARYEDWLTPVYGA